MKLLTLSDLKHFWGNVRKHLPTKTSDLTNDSNFVDTSNSAVASGITSAKVTSYDSHIADTDIHVITADKSKWNNGVSQSYVLRYVSASVTDNSTISYSTLDNTDNIKSGDKVIDVDGKIFSVVSVDTANQTVTVGSALIDLALDGDVVHTSGNETVRGQKTFSDRILINNNIATIQDEVPYLLLKNPIVERASTTLEGYQQIRFVDKNANNIGTISAQTYTSGTSDIIITSYSQDGSATRTTGVIVRRSPTASKFHPYSDNVTALGETNRRWSRVYATEYYYGSNNVEFSNKFVTSDTAQTVSGSKTFSSDLNISNTDTTANTPNLNLSNYKAERGTTDSTVQTITFLDKNSKALSLIESRIISNGNTATNILCYNTNTSNNTVFGGVAIIKSPTETNFAPNADNAVTCGRPLARWSKVYGIEYYYGNSSVEFSNKFVTVDTAQTITGRKTFTSTPGIYNSDNTANTPNIILRSSKSARGTSDTDAQTILFNDKNNDSLASIKTQNFSSNGATYLLSSVNTKDTNDQLISASTSLYILNNGRKVFRPESDNDILLGYTNYRWKDVQTNLVNGLTPSSLSMPDIDNRIDISSYITDLTGVNNEYTPTVNGWICVRSGNATKISILDSATNIGNASVSNTATYLTVLTPCIADKKVYINIVCSSLSHAYFIPCQGNV